MKITNIEPQKKHKNRVNVFIDDEFAFGIDEFQVLRFKLKIGRELNCDELSAIKDEVLFSDAKNYALSLVSKSFYTEKGISLKLKNRGTDDETIDKTVDFLKEYGYIDDLEFAKKYIDECLNIKKYGKLKIIMLLKEKSVPSFIIDEALEFFDFDETENNNLIPLVEKKLGGDFEYKNIMKVKRYFASRGYDFDAIDSAIRKVTDCSEVE